MGDIQRDALKDFGVSSQKIFIANEYPGFIFWDNNPKKNDLSDCNVLLNIGRLVEVKGITYLLKAFAKVQYKYPNLYLHIVGDGGLKESLIKESENLNIRKILFTDHVTDITLKKKLYNNAKFVIVPSIALKAEKEGGPLVILEALSSGTPVIASDCTGSTGHFIVNGQNGYITEQKNAYDLALKIELLIDKIEKNEINRDSVKKHFDEIPNHNHQYAILRTAIKSLYNV